MRGKKIKSKSSKSSKKFIKKKGSKSKKKKKSRHRKGKGKKLRHSAAGSNEDPAGHDDNDSGGGHSPTNSNEGGDKKAEDNQPKKASKQLSKESDDDDDVDTASESGRTQKSADSSRRRHRVKKFKKVRVRRKKFQFNHEDEEKQKALQEKYDEEVRSKVKQEVKAAAQAAFADFSAVGKSTEEISKTFITKLYAVVLLGRATGRYPIYYSKDELTGDYVFEYNLKYPAAIIFLITNICLTILFVAGVISVFSFWMELKVGIDYKWVDRNTKLYIEGRGKNTTTNKTEIEKVAFYLRNRKERYVYDRHIIFFLMSWCFLLHNVISGWHVWFSMNYIIKYLNFWLSAVNTMCMDVTQSAVLPVLVGIGFSVAVTGCFVAASLLKAIPSMVGMPTFIAIIIGRDFNPELLEYTPETKNSSNPTFRPAFQVLYFVGICIHAYLLMSSYFFALLCMMICKYLKNAFLMWNGRVYSSLLRGGDYIHSKEGRSTYALLYKDHCILLDLVEGTDRVFMYILESFCGLTVLSLCLEVYFIIRTGQKGYSTSSADESGYFIRQHDWVAGTVLTVQHIVLLIMVLRMTAGVGEEAMAGLEIIRRKTMLGRKADEELYFMLSMFCSYTSDNPIALCGGGFFLCNKDFIIGVVATVISYFTLVFQFEPQLDFKVTADDTDRETIKNFLETLEKHLWEQHL